ncbi:MAG: hypothetical protein HYX77_09135 [Acidobacteria bacterium]|nr:hypothetical protein [Acidobacteriota bacterium]
MKIIVAAAALGVVVSGQKSSGSAGRNHLKRLLVVLLVAGAFAAIGGRAFAHHSFAATYLENQSVTIEGELVQFLFRNPHSFVHVMVKEKDGTMVRYAVEWGGAGQLGGQGVTRETLKLGDYVVITGSPSRNPEDHRVRMASLRRPKDGFGWGQRLGEVVD